MIITGDVLAWAAQYDGPPFSALLCDPPYELAFMNKGWDNTGIAFRPETWAALAEHLHPGAFGMAFAGSGSEVIGATLAGWEDVVGIEQDAGYVAIAEQRLAFWQRFVGADGWEATQERARAWADAEEARAALEAGGQLTLPLFDEAAR